MNDSRNLDLRSIRKTPWAWTVATFFGTGLLRPGPGTWGSVAATLLFSSLVAVFHPPAPQLLALTLVGILLAVATGIPAATIAARECAGKDPGFVVIDEVAGVWIALLAAIPHPDWKHILAALLLFRAFDIAKPFPIRRIEKLPAGFGIVCDDLAAGLYAGAGVLLLARWL